MRSWFKNISLKLAAGYLASILILSLTSGILLIWFGWNTNPNIDIINAEPFQNLSYLFGTNELGQNVLGLVIAGTKYSICISLFSALFAACIGILIGGFAGYFGDSSIFIKRYQLISAIAVLPILWFYLNLSFDNFFILPRLFVLLLAGIFSFVIWKPLCFLLKKIAVLNQPIKLPIDILNTKVTEIVFAIPSYFIILAFSSFLGNSIWTIVFVLAITSWPQSALLIRAEMLKIREMSYIKALKNSGIGHFQILIRHAVPNAINPVLVNFVFFISGLLIVESTLSFIGVGLSGDIITWGKVISGYKQNTANWWVVLFPGTIIFLTILSFHRLGSWLEERFSL